MLTFQDRLPLAVVGSNTIIEVNGKRIRGRQYPWGVAEGEPSFTISPLFDLSDPACIGPVHTKDSRCDATVTKLMVRMTRSTLYLSVSQAL